MRRAISYLAKVPVAISGQKGHDTAFTGLGKVVRRFALTRDMAEEVVVDWNNRCDPPWSAAELAHKLDSIYADTHDADDWGQLLTTTTTDDINNPVGDKPKPTLEISTKRDQVIDAALHLLPRDPDLYLMSNVLVNLVQVAEEDATLYGGVALRHALGTHVTNVLDADQLSYHLTRTADCYCWKQTKHGESVTKPTHPPDWLLKNLIKFAVKSPLRPLRGIVDAPILRPDGSLHTEAGYDPVTGYFYAPAGPVPPLPDRPAHADASRAAADLFEVVHQFPFASDADKAVWLAGLLTVLARPAIMGPTPGFAFLGNRAGVGKGRLIDIIGIIATDRTVPCTSYPETKEEAIKCKVAFALATTPIVHLDNLDEGSVYGHGVIDSAITSTKINDRILGSNTLTKNLELALCWFLSGNNLSPGKDAYRRWLVCNLVTQEENPEERPDLKIKDILAYVTSRRTTLLGSALTILKAQRAGGPPDRRLGTPGVVRELGPHSPGRGLVGHRRGLLHHPQNRRGRGPRTPQQNRAPRGLEGTPRRRPRRTRRNHRGSLRIRQSHLQLQHRQNRPGALPGTASGPTQVQPGRQVTRRSDAQSHPPLAERIQDRRPGVQRLRHRQTRRQVVRHRGEDPVTALITR